MQLLFSGWSCNPWHAQSTDGSIKHHQHSRAETLSVFGHCCLMFCNRHTEGHALGGPRKRVCCRGVPVIGSVVLTCKALDLRVVSALSQAAQLSVQALHLLPQAAQLHINIWGLLSLHSPPHHTPHIMHPTPPAASAVLCALAQRCDRQDDDICATPTPPRPPLSCVCWLNRSLAQS